MSSVTIIDYGIGNLLSVKRACEYCGADVNITDCPDVIEKAERLILPGVGAFADGMEGLKDRGLIESIKKYTNKNKPFMGICLGMQMMLEIGEEFGLYEGLGLIQGKVSIIPNEGVDGSINKIPHIGWNFLIGNEEVDWEGTILQDVEPFESVYFVHSYSAMPEKSENRLADCNYNGRIISAVIKSGNLYGCQFHPEKSGPVGLKIIKNFLSLK